jgi:hypothetical protein
MFLISFVFLASFASAQETSFLCAGQSKTLTASATGGTAPITYTWTDGTTLTSGATRVVTISGTYTWTATDASGCTASGTHNVTVEADPTASLAIVATNACLNVGQTVSATGVPVGYSYSWNFGSGATPATSSAASQSVAYTTVGTKTITLTISKTSTGSTNGCSATCTWTKTTTITIGSLSGSSTCG